MKEKTPGVVDMDVVVAKVITILVITCLTVLCGLVPCRMMQYCGKSLLKRKQTYDYIVSGAKCFAGGVFLGTCFLHLIPETRNKVDSVLQQLESRSKYPLAELLTIAGFFGVTFGEHVIKFLYYKFQDQESCISYDDDSYSFDQDYIPTTEDPVFSGREIECRSIKSLSNNQLATTHDNVQTHLHEVRENDTRIEMEIEPAPLQEMEARTVVTELSRGEEGQGQIRSVLFLTALSLHGVFEGMALGLQSFEGDVWVMCVAIALHRSILSFGMGLQHSRNFERPATIVFIISAFSIICAVGIIIGIAISAGAQLYSDVDVPNAILQSLATGTIFYIIFLNILYKELDGNKDVKKISCAFVGFAFMAVVFAIVKQ